MSSKVSSFFIAYGIIPEDDRDVYVYSFEVLFSTLLSFLALAVLAVFTRTVLETAIFLLGFVPLRLIAGGYHAKNHFRCFLILMCVYCTFLMAIFFLPPSYIEPVILSSVILSVLLVFLIAPSEDSNKPITGSEKVRFRKASRLAVVCYVIVIGLGIVLLPEKIYSCSLALGIITVGISLLANLIKCKKQGRKESCSAQRGGNDIEEV